MDLLSQSKEVRKEADILLSASGLLPYLESKGKVIFTGSYDTDLMLAPDIDLHVVTGNNDKEAAQAVLNDLITQDFFRTYVFRDFIAHPKEGFPRGYYLGLKTDHKEQKWKVDVWLLESPYEGQKELMEALKALDEASRIKILELKEKKLKGEIALRSYDIYRQVLNI